MSLSSDKSSSQHALAEILAKMASIPRGRSLAVFDLDSTLYELTLRVSAIVDRFRQDPVQIAKFPDACRRLEQIEIRRTDWGLREPLERIGIDSKSDSEFVQELQKAWARGFFSNDFLDRDFPLPGAVRFVEACLQNGADVLYLTGRDVARMGAGTEKSLRACGFPFDGMRSRLTLKPQADLDDAEFKADVMAELAKKYDTLWLFENEPVNINAVLKRTPSVGIVFIETCHSGVEDVQNALASVPHFEVPLKVPLADLE